MSYSILNFEPLRALESGTHSDPFSCLGFHNLSNEAGSVIRVFNPAFRGVSIEHEGKVTPCENQSGNGCFEAVFPGRSEFFPYRICAFLESGESATFEDPYAFLPVLSDFDLHLISQGTHYRLWEKLGANPMTHQGVAGVHFAIWAPNARGVSVVGDFNGWNPRSLMMRRRDPHGVWEIFAPGLQEGSCYKFAVQGADGIVREKMDPVGRGSELRPRTGSVVPESAAYAWRAAEWEGRRADAHSDRAALSVYEVHLGSWRGDSGSKAAVTYSELAESLVPYVRDMGYTHIELMPIQEHPLDESWGYQVTGYYAPTRRHGTPLEFKAFVDACHLAGIGVILDWVPAHFPMDAHALCALDGTELYAHEDPRRGKHPEWGTMIFNYDRREVANFLIANALFWLEEYRIDGLRVDAVASMLYLDYARRDGEWLPDPGGSNINGAAVEFLKHLNSVVAQRCPNRVMIAEESTAFPGVTRRPEDGGLGFRYKWNMGWMHDFLTYISKEPIHRRYHHDQLTFEMSYAFTERFMLPLSHDEVVHGKGSLIRKMPGDDWQKFANNRSTFAYLVQPGSLHAGLQNLVRDLNRLYRTEPALRELDLSYEGFQWIDFHDRDQNVICFLRRGHEPNDTLVCVFNFSPIPRHDYRIGVPRFGHYAEILNTDAALYGGGNVGNFGGQTAEAIPAHNFSDSLSLSLPPLGAVWMKRVEG
jgi:1,4-alpha-glucan branching enzyme